MRNHCVGFTLVELMLTIVISSIVMMGAAVLHIGFVKQNIKQQDLVQRFGETRAVFHSFKNLIERSGETGVAAPIISGDKKTITVDSQSLGCIDDNIVFVTKDGSTVTLSPDSQIRFGLDPDDDIYTATMMRGDYLGSFEATEKTWWN